METHIKTLALAGICVNVFAYGGSYALALLSCPLGRRRGGPFILYQIPAGCPELH